MTSQLYTRVWHVPKFIEDLQNVGCNSNRYAVGVKAELQLVTGTSRHLALERSAVARRHLLRHYVWGQT